MDVKRLWEEYPASTAYIAVSSVLLAVIGLMEISGAI